MRAALAIGGAWTGGSKVEVQLRPQGGSMLLTLTENTIVPLPPGTRSIVIAPVHALPGFQSGSAHPAAKPGLSVSFSLMTKPKHRVKALQRFGVGRVWRLAIRLSSIHVTTRSST